tara:strand:- start:2548 stop:2808 length:261 start_codon:yes stop_codon:yes gene_type:complete
MRRIEFQGDYEGNINIANSYYLMGISDGVPRELVVKNAERIAAAGVDFRKYFEEYGNFRNLECPGIGDATKLSVRRILRNEARESA